MTTKPKPEFNARAYYDIYQVTLAIRDKICGGTPKNPELLAGWIAATTEHNDSTTTSQEKEAREALLEPTEEKSWNGFPGDAGGIFVWARQVKALFKECASMLRITTTKIGSKQILQHGFEVKGLGGKADRVHLGGKRTADGYLEGPIHVQTAQGPRTAIKRVDYVEGVTLEFEVWILSTHAAEKRHVGEEELRRMLTFGQENGLGADRSQGHGKFDVVGFAVVQKAAKEPEEVKTKEPKKKSVSATAPSWTCRTSPLRCDKPNLAGPSPYDLPSHTNPPRAHATILAKPLRATPARRSPPSALRPFPVRHASSRRDPPSQCDEPTRVLASPTPCDEPNRPMSTCQALSVPPWPSRLSEPTQHDIPCRPTPRDLPATSPSTPTRHPSPILLDVPLRAGPARPTSPNRSDTPVQALPARRATPGASQTNATYHAHPSPFPSVATCHAASCLLVPQRLAESVLSTPHRRDLPSQLLTHRSDIARRRDKPDPVSPSRPRPPSRFGNLSPAPRQSFATALPKPRSLP
jgi:hypothetical protein